MAWTDTACMPWPGAINEQGYGVIARQGKSAKRAHVAMWVEAFGPVPEGLVLDHLCRNRCCVNVNHLEPVTPKENTLRGEGPTAVNARKAVCDKGHPLDGENLDYHRLGYRRCRECQREYAAVHKDRKREDPMRTLLLPLKSEYFDAIKAGTKTTEFRLCTHHWTARLQKAPFRKIVLTRGYPPAGDTENRIERPWRGFVRTTITHPHFGDEPVEVFAIDVGATP